jgi:glycosyltransferase involved in cell wall biosynthesis
MRILLVADEFFVIGGIQEILSHLGAEFIAAGHTVAVLSTPHRGTAHVARPGLECVALPIPLRKPATWRHLERLVRPPRGTAELVNFIRDWRPDVVNSHLWRWDHIPTIAHACRKAGAPLVHSFDGFPPIRTASGDRGIRAVRRVCAITTLSADLRQFLESLAPAIRRAHVIIGGVDLEAAASTAPFHRERPYILCAARLDLIHKAIDELVSSFAILARDYPHIDLLIAGDGPGRGDLEKVIASARLGGRVGILGAKPQRELWGLYKGATLFAMPSRSREGLGLVFLEAMACGTPVVATRTGGVPEIVLDGETGLLVDRNEPAEIAAAIRTLLDNPELREAMGRRGQELAANYAWPRVAERYLRVYASCLDGRRNRR